ncbi:ankyrin repeat domain-containing protein [Histomonas meleagridis]|uniref:ankyrin repeat domain-containing protein n=1 Tax=Histomonas meleagridis TaxID=135588 RepID=UPI003559BAF8|nr:ankyrin repeat domain-containing protein [Histomonas meleagridis]KAH0802005.1 ankyrin repeat domain-containing protein [Histomonas meleagridis]
MLLFLIISINNKYENINDKLRYKFRSHKNEATGKELVAIEKRFHDLIKYRNRFNKDVDFSKLEMPKITPELATHEMEEFFAVPGMYGGFSYKLVKNGGHYELHTSSWSRVIEGSGQKHIITENETKLVEEGFV